jgi:hypothetical protein
VAGGGAAGGRGGRGGRGGAATQGVVFVKTKSGSYDPHVVRLGLQNFDVAEITSGIVEGDQVALVAAAILQQARTQFQEQIRSRTSLPGMGSSTSGSSRSGGAQAGTTAPPRGGGPGGGPP